MHVAFKLLLYLPGLHRWARLLKQQSWITVYSLPTKENKLPFSFPFVTNKRKLLFPFSVCSQQTEVAFFR
jgi:hypothetical protein